MIVASVDVGSKNVHVVVMDGATVIARVEVASSLEPQESADRALAGALSQASIGLQAIGAVVATGTGKKAVGFATQQVTEVTADARGAYELAPEARTIIDVGADEARAISVDGRGKVLDFAVNERCAAGAGAFVEAMSRALEVELGEFGLMSLESTQPIPMNAQCTVFAESEVVSLIHENVLPADIARAVHDAMASRVSAMVRRAGVNEPLAVGGGVAQNPGFVKALERALGGLTVNVLPEPAYLGAFGAALLARDAGAGEQSRARLSASLADDGGEGE